MDDSDETTKIEDEIRAAMHSRQLMLTPDCLPPDVLLELADDALSRQETERCQAHIAVCAYCRREFVELKADLYEADQLNAAAPPVLAIVRTEEAAAEASSVPSSQRSAWQTWAAWTGIAVASSAAAAALLLFAFRHPVGALPEKTIPIVRTGPAPESNSVAPLPENAHPSVPALQAHTAAPKPSPVSIARSVPNIVLPPAHHHRPPLVSPAPLTAEQGSAAEWNKWRKAAQVQIAEAKQNSAAFNARPGTLGGEGTPLPTVSILRPVGVIREMRPEIEWQAVPDANLYEVTMFKNNKYRDIIEHSIGEIEKRPDGTFYAALTKDLTAGQSYLCQVDAYKEKVRIAHIVVCFYVLNTLSLPKASTMRQHLEFGDGYAERGMLEEAEHEYRAIPKSSPLYEKAQQRMKEAVEKRRAALTTQK